MSSSGGMHGRDWRFARESDRTGQRATLSVPGATAVARVRITSAKARDDDSRDFEPLDRPFRPWPLVRQMTPTATELVEGAAPATKRVRIRKFPVRRLPKMTTTDDDERDAALEPSPTSVDASAFSSRSSLAAAVPAAALVGLSRERVVLYEEGDDAAVAVHMTTRKPTRKRFKQQKKPSVTLLDDLRVSYLKKAPRLQNETLRAFLGDATTATAGDDSSGVALPQRQHVTWQKLLEAALSLEELHARGVVHGRLQCRNILIATDGSQRARVRHFGALSNQHHSSTDAQHHLQQQQQQQSHVVDDHTARWTAPECLDGGARTQASDVFAFGMCVLEAVTRADPWGAVSSDVARVLQAAGRLPSRPSAFARDGQWELVERMCAREPLERGDMAAALRHLRRFAAQEQRERVQQQREAPTVLYDASGRL